MSRERMEFDLLIVGAGPSGLSAAIKFRQLCQKANLDLSVCILEKGATVGAHILSGAVLEPRALNELLPNWPTLNAPLSVPALHDQFLLLTKNHAISLPTPPQMHNQGNYIVRLGYFCEWLGTQAENSGVQIFPGFAATDILRDDTGKVIGVATGDMGLNKEGEKTSQFQPGVEIIAKHTLFAEGCRGSLSQQLMALFNLRTQSDPQTYGIGIKELWEIPSSQHQMGTVIHTIGWPLDTDTYGGSFLYHLNDNQLAIGFVVGLDYKNPYLNPYQEFQRFKHHPAIVKILKGGRRLAYGARAINEGGLQSIPTLTFPGGSLIGCAAGFLNVPKIKGTHTAMKSGMLAAESVFDVLTAKTTINTYEEKLKQSWVYEELYQVRNVRPAFTKGLWAGLVYSAIDTYVLRGKAPWTFGHTPDHLSLKKASACMPINYPKPDGIFSFDLMSSVYLSNTNHREDQPAHLKLKNPTLAISVNWKEYASPEQRYCPAGVYEIVHNGDEKVRLQINAQNCVHCKTCDIKDPLQNIVWVPPEGGGGPNYVGM